jgi:ubiquinone/menaquinone biosynthesis C-methylase UbiE
MTFDLEDRFDLFWTDEDRVRQCFLEPEQWFIEWAQILNPKGLKVLDLGCGNGRNAIALAKMGAIVKGIDVSSVALELLQNRAKKENVEVETFMGNMNRLPFPDRTFDMVICYNAIFNTSLKSIKESIKETKRVLKKNAIFLVTFRSTKSPIPEEARLLEDEANSYVVETDGFELISHRTDMEEIEKLSSGWELLKAQEFCETLGTNKDKREVVTWRVELQKTSQSKTQFITSQHI